MIWERPPALGSTCSPSSAPTACNSSWADLSLPLAEKERRAISSAAKEVLSDWIGSAASMRQLDWSPSVASSHSDAFLQRLGKKLDRPSHVRLLAKMQQAPLVDVVPSLLTSDARWDCHLSSLADDPEAFAAGLEAYARAMRLLQWWREELVPCFGKERLVEILVATGMPMKAVGENAELMDRLGLSESSGAQPAP